MATPDKLAVGKCSKCKQKKELVEASCGHSECKECWEKYIDEEFVVKKRSPLLVLCPQCSGKPLEHTDIRNLAGDQGKAIYDYVMATIPATNPTKLEDMRYHYNESGSLVHMDAGEKYRYISELHYETLGDLVVTHIQNLMKARYNMREVLLPVGVSEGPFNNIFVTPDLEENHDKLMIIIQGSGAVRPGQWARALCLNNTLDEGSILPYIDRAVHAGYALAILNPNQNSGPKAPPPPLRREEFFNTDKSYGRSRYKSMSIQGNEDPESHTIYAWERVVSRSPASQIVIVAHSAGGYCTGCLLNEKWHELKGKLKAIALTDSFLPGFKEPEIKQFIQQHCINWVASEKPLDTLIRVTTGSLYN